MPAYLVETFLARGDAAARAGLVRGARSAARRLRQGETQVLFQGAIYVPGDETCFFLFDAPSARDATLAATHAELDPVRVVEAILFGRERERDEAEVEVG